jgi:cytochrome c biogenesis protein CcmG/thiol:disulfide interchange protein DsbE
VKTLHQSVEPLSLSGSESSSSKGLPRHQVLIGVILALAIVGGAWVVGGKAGLDQIGRGGINRQFMPRVGEVAPELLMIGPDGAPARLSDFRGQPVWLNFWGSWCPPCRSELPDIQRAYETLSPRGVVLIALSIDQSRASATEYARANGATFPVYNVPSRSLIADDYDLRNVPTHMFIDANGVIRSMVAGSLSEGAAVSNSEALLAVDRASTGTSGDQ